MNPLRVLLRVHLRQARNAIRAADRDAVARGALFAVLLAAYCVSADFLFGRVVERLLGAPLVGLLLLHRLVALLYLAVFTMLWFGGMVAALETYFLAPDVDFLSARPLRRSTFLHYKFLRTYALSAWMVYLVVLPTLHGYARVVGRPAGFTLLVLPVVFALTVPPVSLSAAATVGLMRYLPVDRAKEIVFTVGALISLLFVSLVRFLSPKYLFDPTLFEDFLGYVERFRAPGAPWLPSNLATEATLAAGTRPATYLSALGALSLGAVATYALSHAAALALYRADRPRSRGAFDLPPWERRLGLTALVDRILRPLPPAARALVGREAKGHMRDPTQISHLLLLGSVALLHLINLREIPAAYLTDPIRNLIAFLNLALVGFLAAAVAVRFVYPAVSLEGRALWISLQAPIPPGALHAVKLAATGGPLVLSCAALLWLTNAAIGLSAPMQAFTIGAGVLMAATIALLAALFGAAYPRFDTGNVFEISSGAGGISFMVSALVYVAASISLLATPALGLTFGTGAWWAARPVLVAAGLYLGLHAALLPWLNLRGRARVAALGERIG